MEWLGSLNEPRPHVGRWDLAYFGSSEPSIPVFRDEAVASIADSTRNDPKEGEPRPGRTQPRKDSKNRVRLEVDRIVLDQNNAGQFASTFSMIFNYRLTSR